MTTVETKNAKKLEGKVVSISMKDTVIVSVERYKKHPKYGKYIRLQKRHKAHDEGNTCVLGEKVTIMQCRPYSKDKSFKVVK